jgi:hypothetical protein
MVEFWNWGTGTLKVHVDVAFGNHLKRCRRKPSAIYQYKSGKTVGYDFVMKRDERRGITKQYGRFNKASGLAKVA